MGIEIEYTLPAAIGKTNYIEFNLDSTTWPNQYTQINQITLLIHNTNW